MLSIIIPAYNEEDNISLASNRISELMNKNDIDYEIIFVSDGSKDKTYENIIKENKLNNHIKGLAFSRNFGKEPAIFSGLEAAQGDCCVVIDCDLQHPPEKIIEMYHLWEEGYEVVEGIKLSRGKESFFHKISAGMFYRMISKTTGIDMQSTSDFKLLDRRAVDVLLSLTERNTFFRALSFWVGFTSTNVTYEVTERIAGETKWSFKSLIKYAISNITAFTSAPLQLITIFGIILLVMCSILGIQTIYNYAIGKSIEGFTTVILLLMIIGGCIMLSLGIIGYYISKIYEEIKGRPRYIVSNRTGFKKEQD